MLGDLLNRLTGAAPQPEPEADYRRSLAALLVRCARIDGQYDPDEVARIDRILATRYALSPDAAAALRAEGEALEAEAGDTQHLTSAIKTGVPYEERGAIVEALWSVVLADDARDNSENALLRLVVSLLGVNDVDSAHARQRAAAALGREG